MQQFFSLAKIAFVGAFITGVVGTPVWADVATVATVHEYVTRVWNITVSHNTAKDSNIISMKYLMQVVDAANEQLNGVRTTDYSNDSLRATADIASTAAVKSAVETLIEKQVEYKFFMYSYNVGYSKGISISAAGTFYIDWGDGTKETIIKEDASTQYISHVYNFVGDGYIALGGKATGYSDDENIGVINLNFYDNSIISIDGCLGCVFSTLEDGSQPRFIRTFYLLNTLVIPEHLFDGITGAPVSNMFNGTFEECVGLTVIPDNLFSGIEPTAEYPDNLFYRTFYGDARLTDTAKINGRYLYEIWTPSVCQRTYGNTSLDVPDMWSNMCL